MSRCCSDKTIRRHFLLIINRGSTVNISFSLDVHFVLLVLRTFSFVSIKERMQNTAICDIKAQDSLATYECDHLWRSLNRTRRRGPTGIWYIAHQRKESGWISGTFQVFLTDAVTVYFVQSMLTPSVQDARTRRLQMTSWTPGETGSAIPLPDIRLARRELRHMTTEIVPGPSRSVHKSTDSRTNVGHVLDSMDDADEDYDLGIPTVYVHQEVLSLFTLIGDVFDDDKVSWNDPSVLVLLKRCLLHPLENDNIAMCVDVRLKCQGILDYVADWNESLTCKCDVSILWAHSRKLGYIAWVSDEGSKGIITETTRRYVILPEFFYIQGIL